MEDRNTPSGRTFSRNRLQSERALGRGLEDISHLFLSQAVREHATGADAREGLPEPGEKQQRESALVVPLSPLAGVSRDQVVSLLNGHPTLLEEGLSIIDEGIPVHECGLIDLLAADLTGRLAVIDIDGFPNDTLLMRGISHCNWLVSNIPILRRMYRGFPIDYASNPRLFLVAPDFSMLHRSVTTWTSNPLIRCFRFRAVALGGGAGILIEQA